MKLYDSLSKKIVDLKPISASEVSVYTCGPTVYDHVHIGNLRTYITEDILRRTIKAGDKKVKHAMNLTDVDDKTIARSSEKYSDDKPIDALKKLTSNYEAIFIKDAKDVGIDFSATTFARATEHIPEMQALINKIPNKYVAEDGIYFDINKYPDYGVLVKLDRSHKHHRINNDEYDKEHVADFALWRASKPNEPSWDFKIDDNNIAGHPGWHVECSAMSAKYLGQPFDIHTGGVDLKFPHHENEIAQSKVATGKDLAKLWMHSEHLLVDGKKMSKSLKNFYTLEDITKKGFDPLAFRLLMLQAHYRSQLNFTWDSLKAAQNNLQSLRSWADIRFQNLKSSKLLANYNEVKQEILQKLKDDLNTPQALSSVNGAINQTEKLNYDSQAIGVLAKFIDNLLGFNLTNSKDINSEQKTLIENREIARNTKDWNKSDELRRKLEEQGVGLRDTDQGPIWFRL